MASAAAVLEWLLRRATWISRLGIWAGGLLLMAAVVMIVVEILMRRTVGWSFRGAHELSGYVLAISAAWSFAFALQEKAHIRVDVFYARLSRAGGHSSICWPSPSWGSSPWYWRSRRSECSPPPSCEIPPPTPL